MQLNTSGVVNFNGGSHSLVIINQHTQFYQNRRQSCKFLIELTWNAPVAVIPGVVVLTVVVTVV